VKTEISSYLNVQTNLKLVNITYDKNENGEICAHVNENDQVENSQKLLSSVLLYDENNLPHDLDAKIAKLEEWLKNIRDVDALVPLFLGEKAQNQQRVLNKKEKIFLDLYSKALLKSSSLVWKSCHEDRTRAKEGLNELIFENGINSTDKGFFSSIVSIFKSDKNLIIDLFDSYIKYTKSDEKECALVKKEDLLIVTNRMKNELLSFNLSELSDDPKVRYDEINKLLNKIEITQKLLKVFAKKFTTADFDRLNSLKKKLSTKKSKTYPQYVFFSIKGAKNIEIVLDSKTIPNNKKVYIPTGEHTYIIKADGVCPIKNSFENKLKNDEEISEDLLEYIYPTVIFVSDKNANIVLNGRSFKSNVVETLPECRGDFRYVATYAGQTKSGSIEIEPAKKEQIELLFLSSEELSVFNDAKIKTFEVESDMKFSESLTPIASDKFEFVLEDGVKHGKIDLDEQGSFKYRPDDGFVGLDSFEYIIKTKDKKSAVKIVNIIVKKSKNIPTDTLVKKEQNKEEEIQKKKEINKKNIIDEVSEERYQKFKIYVESQKQNIEKLKKLQKRYPKMFNRLLKEKFGNIAN
jgi:hypothetical protein